MSMLRSSSTESAEGLLPRKDDAGPSQYDSQGQVADCLGQASLLHGYLHSDQSLDAF